MAKEVQWHMKGELVGACNCDWGCPCNFDAPPTYGGCEGPYIWHVQEGRYGDVVLDGLNMCIIQSFPGPLHEGHGIAQFIVDARADARQRDAILTLLNGDSGGVFAIFASITQNTLEPIYATFEASINGLNSHVSVPGILEVGLTPIKNPETDQPEEIKLLKPTGITSTESDLGASTVCRFNGGFQHDHSGKYGEYAPFNYKGGHRRSVLR